MVTEAESMEWVRRASEYRTLTGKRDQLGYPLGMIEMARLAELERFFEESVHVARMAFNQRDMARAEISVFVTFGPAGTLRGLARDISADGLFVETAAPLPVGAKTVVAVMDNNTAEEWRFTAEVVRLGSDGMGLRFVGIPLSMRVGHRRATPPQSRPLKKAA